MTSAGCGEIRCRDDPGALAACRLLTMGDSTRDQMSNVVDAHITTLHVIIRDGIKGPGGAIGIALAAGLDKAIVKFHLALGTHGACRLSDEVAAASSRKSPPLIAVHQNNEGLGP